MKIKLNKKQRREAYKYALDHIGSKNHLCICGCLSHFLDRFDVEFNDDYTHHDFQEIFPELAKHKPSVLSWGKPWWPFSDFKSRIDLLKHLIKELETDKNEKDHWEGYMGRRV